MFGVVPRQLWSKLNPPDENNMCTWSMRCLLIEKNNKLILIDTGMGNKQDDKFRSHFQPHGENDLISSIKAKGFEPGDITDVLITHFHFDHVGGLAELKQEVNVPIYIHPDAVEMLDEAFLRAASWQIRIPPPPPADVLLKTGETINIGNLKLEVLFTPGHAPGHVSLLLADHLFCGDAVFAGSIGRTDLSGGSLQELMGSIRDRILTLPDHIVLHPGQGPATTGGQERLTNPFIVGIR